MLRSKCFRFSLSLRESLSSRHLFYTTTAKNLDVYLYNTLDDTIQALPKSDKALAWYTCGPTTYAPAHMGHARTYVCLDIMRRVVEAHAPKAPLFVMNITDIDDKIIAAANELETSPLELARHYENEFWNDLDSLNCLRPTVVTRVTERIESDIIPFIQRLVEKGMAYKTADGVYFDIKEFNEKHEKITKYGKLAPPAASEDINPSSSRGTIVSKKDTRDFVLWKNKKADEDVSWPSPWGEGRPGWHIECSAMIEAVQNQFQASHKFLIHSGGVDLCFPHHTNEIAQSEAYHEDEWINFWIHTGHVHIDGLKMSKSLKNFISIQEFLAEYDVASPLESPGDDFRLWCLGLSGSYRGAATFSKKQISEARSIRQKILKFLVGGESWVSSAPLQNTKMWNEKEMNLFHLSMETRQKCLMALRTDLDGSRFLEELMKIVEYGNRYLGEEPDGPIEPMKTAIQNVRQLLSLVGFSENTTQIGLRATSSDVGDQKRVIEKLVSFRSSVRKIALDSAGATSAEDKTDSLLQFCDEIRDSMLEDGIELLDSKHTGSDDWRFCLPKSTGTRESGLKELKHLALDLSLIPLEDFFRVGDYKGMFAELSSEGIPIRNSDGSEISKRMLKKLLKKYEVHKKRLERSQKQEEFTK